MEWSQGGQRAEKGLCKRKELLTCCPDPESCSLRQTLVLIFFISVFFLLPFSQHPETKVSQWASELHETFQGSVSSLIQSHKTQTFPKGTAPPECTSLPVLQPLEIRVSSVLWTVSLGWKQHPAARMRVRQHSQQFSWPQGWGQKALHPPRAACKRELPLGCILQVFVSCPFVYLCMLSKLRSLSVIAAVKAMMWCNVQRN